MKFARVIALLICVGLVWGSLHCDVQAQTLGNYGAAGFPGPGYFGYAGSPYSLGQIPTPPYFSLHPPVYYSYPVPRTYGYSPYAYPGTVPTPEIIQPEIIENPHVNRPAKESPALNMRVVQAEVVHNPYVRHEVKMKLSPRLAGVR